MKKWWYNEIVKSLKELHLQMKGVIEIIKNKTE